MTKSKRCCGSCGSTNIKIDAWAEWNEETQEMELSQTFDDAFCEDCEQTGSYECVDPEEDDETPDPETEPT